MTAEAKRRSPRVGILVFDGVEELDFDVVSTQQTPAGFVGAWVTAQDP